MDSKSHKFYHIHEIDSREHSDLYYSGKEGMVFKEDSLIFPMANLHYQFSMMQELMDLELTEHLARAPGSRKMAARTIGCHWKKHGMDHLPGDSDKMAPESDPQMTNKERKAHNYLNSCSEVRSVQDWRTMDSNSCKLYHIHGLDSRDLSDLYYSDKENMVFGEDSLIFPMMNLHYQFSSCRVVGKTLIDISIGSFIHHLYSASNFFQKMIVLKFNEKCIMELCRWLHNRTGAYDWTHTSAAAAELEGNRDQLQEKESCLKSSIKQIVKCDFEQENITSPVELPLTDCVLIFLIMNVINKNEDEYMRNLEKISKLLKPGGQLLLISVIDATYFIAGGERFQFFKHDEAFVKNALSKLGLVIDYCAVQRRRNVSDLTDYKASMFTVAIKGE
ncbi:indolethylamine N-methyltransferase-like [Mantella aurantiaca]